ADRYGWVFCECDGAAVVAAPSPRARGEGSSEFAPRGGGGGGGSPRLSAPERGGAPPPRSTFAAAHSGPLPPRRGRGHFPRGGEGAQTPRDLPSTTVRKYHFRTGARMHSRLLRVAAIFIGIVGASVSTPAARAGGTGDLWVFVVGHMCLAQDVKYRTTPFGQSLMFMLSHRGDFDSRPITVCFRERRWASEALCNDLMTT